MTLERLAHFIQAVGFPVAATAYILYMMNSTMAELTRALVELRAALGTCVRIAP
jgi:hypothetical protein